MNEISNWFLTSNISEGDRFRSFGLPHILYMVCGTIFILGLAYYVRRCTETLAARIITICSVLLVILYFYRAYMFYHYYENFDFLDIVPLHLCIISGFVLPAAVFTKSKLLWNLSYSVLMPGAVAAILTPEVTLTRYHYLGWLPLVFFLWHFMVVLIPVLQVASGRLVPDIRQYPKVVSVLLVYAFAVYFFNKKFNTNYLYLNGAAEGTVLEIFHQWLGDPGYIFPMALLALLASMLMFLPWIKKARKQHEY